MKVHFATDMFRPETVVALHLMMREAGPEGTFTSPSGLQSPATKQQFEATVEYCQHCWELWCLVYAGSIQAGGQKRDKLWTNDYAPHLCMTQDQVKWFRRWRHSCQLEAECVPLGTTLMDMHLFVYGFSGFAEELSSACDTNSNYYLTPARFCQDSLENLFGNLRQLQGSEPGNNPTEQQAAQALGIMSSRQQAKIDKGSYAL